MYDLTMKQCTRIIRDRQASVNWSVGLSSSVSSWNRHVCKTMQPLKLIYVLWYVSFLILAVITQCDGLLIQHLNAFPSLFYYMRALFLFFSKARVSLGNLEFIV